jgi:hypothetical protein
VAREPALGVVPLRRRLGENGRDYLSDIGGGNSAKRKFDPAPDARSREGKKLSQEQLASKTSL